MKAYCVKCKDKREIENASATFTKIGGAATRGLCGVCGTGMFRMGRTPFHAGLEPPEVQKSVKKNRRLKTKRRGKLVIVESPAKARTIGRFLGRDYTLKASMGHVRDLLKSRLAVDVENDFSLEFL